MVISKISNTLPDFLDKDQDACARLLNHTLEVAVVPVIRRVVNLEVVPAQARVPVNSKKDTIKVINPDYSKIGTI